MGAHISVPMYQRTIDERYRMTGQVCNSCNNVVFPMKAACPQCKNNTFSEKDLSGKGSIYSFTVIGAGGAPPEFADQARVEGSYPVVLVELDEGPKIMAQFAGQANLEIGMRVKHVVRRIYDEEGVIRYGYKFIKDENIDTDNNEKDTLGED